jgi:signal transduction histidine kinase
MHRAFLRLALLLPTLALGVVLLALVPEPAGVQVRRLGLVAWPMAPLLALAWHWGLRAFPAALLANFVLHACLLGSVQAAAGLSAIETGGAFVAGSLLRRTTLHGNLGRVVDVLLLALLGAFGSAFVSTVLLAVAQAPAPRAAGFVTAMVSFFLSISLATLGLTPALLAWTAPSRHDAELGRPHQPFEHGLFAVALCVTAGGQASAWHPASGHDGRLAALMLLPVLFWAATRFGQRGTTTCVAVLFSSQLAAAHWFGGGPEGLLVAAAHGEGVIAWQMALCCAFLAILLLGGIVEERRSAVRLRDEFLLVASHELKTPLTALMLGIENMGRCMRRNPAGPAASHLVKVATCQAQIGRLAWLVDGLLDGSQFGHSALRLSLKPHEMGGLVRTAADDMAERAERMRCSITCSVPQAVWGTCDEERLLQLMRVLLDNACKYGAGQPIQVTLKGDARSVSIVVQDHGIGIRDADVRRIFCQFERAVSTRSYGGLGLGLFMARKIAVAHGGELWAERGSNDGATFVLRLPRHPDPTRWQHPV